MGVRREEIGVFGEEHLDGCASVFASEPWRESWTAEASRERLTEIYPSPGFDGAVCTVDGEPVGLALGNSVRRATGRGFLLHELCVKAEMHGAGLGGRLLARLEDRLRGNGVGSVFLVTGLDIPAKDFYERSGYGEATGMAAMVKVL